MYPIRKSIIYIFLLFFLPGFISAKDTLKQRFSPPSGFSRLVVQPNSFASWLRALPLEKAGSPVLDFRGGEFKKAGDSTVAAVVDFNIAGKRLEQCMDILLRFHGTYLIQHGKRDSVIFPLPDGLMLSWPQWREGWRPQFRGLHFHLKQSHSPDSSKQNFDHYLNEIFSNSASHTFYHFYPQIPLQQIRIGDFIVRKSRKGHAVLIVDMVENKLGVKMVMVGQGDTPACQFYILKGKDGSPWFPVDSSSDYLPLPIKKKMYWKGLRRFPAYTD